MGYSAEELDVWVTQQKLPIVSPKYVQSNRATKRATEAELIKVGGELVDVESRFLEQLFSENGRSYNEIYQFYLKQYITNVKACKDIYRPKFVHINEYYFEKTYKSVV